MSAIDEQATQWVARLNASYDTETLHAFRQWHDADPRHEGAFLRAEAAWTLLDRMQVLGHGGQLELRHKAAQARTRREMLMRLGVGGAAAASLTAAAGIGWALKDRLSLTTQRGELRNVPLADRSLASVNTDSRLDIDMTAKIRHIQLVKGEAWFDVAHNPEVPFVVSAGDVRVRAVGTAFSVRRRDAGAEVLVTEGTVEAWSVRDGGRRLRLGIGHEAFVPFAGGDVAAAYHPDEIERQLAWRERKIILQHETLGDAADEFNRYNREQIIINDPALRAETLVGGFEVDKPESFARAVHTAMNVPVSVADGRILIGAQRAG
jgi:transmembrane sensor